MKLIIHLIRTAFLTIFFLLISYVLLLAHYKYNNQSLIFDPYITKMIEDSNGRLSSDDFSLMSYRLKKMEYPVIGQCFPLTQHVIFNKDYWYNHSTELERRILFYHETTHCILGQQHRDDYRKDHCPVSIMNSYSPVDECIRLHYDNYLYELFYEGN